MGKCAFYCHVAVGSGWECIILTCTWCIKYLTQKSQRSKVVVWSFTIIPFTTNDVIDGCGLLIFCVVAWTVQIWFYEVWGNLSEIIDMSWFWVKTLEFVSLRFRSNMLLYLQLNWTLLISFFHFIIPEIG